MEQETLDKHAYILGAGDDETSGEMWVRAGEFTQRCCYDEIETYALIKKSEGRNCGGVDCDKIIDRTKPYHIYDLVRGAGAPGATPIFDDTGHTGKPADFVEPESYDPDPDPEPEPVPVVLPGREEMMLEGQHLDQVYKLGLKRPNGMIKNGAVDWEGVGAWLFDVYLTARVNGKSPDEARAEYMGQIRNSAEWQANNSPGR